MKPYSGTALENPIPLTTYPLPDNDWQGMVQKPEENNLTESIAAYFPGDELVAAVSYARLLKRPLLVRGEPGCGKTRLAQAIAYELYPENNSQNYRLHYFEWHVKSITKVNEGLYQFDHLERLHDVEMKIKGKKMTDYRTFGPLGKAFLSSAPNAPTILLIDEIDKADLDFPNDLLLELDQMRFYIPETRETIEAAEPPIIIITSNDEKELPNAFLRRCVFHYIKFPEEEQLKRIIRSKAQEYQAKWTKTRPDSPPQPLPEGLIALIATKFLDLRKKMADWPNTTKIPATSELLDWLNVIYTHWLNGKIIFTPAVEPQKATLTQAVNDKGQVLFPEVLFKTLEDYQKFANG